MSIEQWAVIVGVILTVLGLVVAVGVPMVRLLLKAATTLGTIDERTIEIQKDLTDQKDISRRCSADVHEKLLRHTLLLQNHAGRIEAIEQTRHCASQIFNKDKN